MNQEKQPEALRLAEVFDRFKGSSHRWTDGQPIHMAVAVELRRQHGNIVEMESLNISRLSAMESLKKELATEASRTANEKLRADQMTEQHRMQCNMRAERDVQLAGSNERAHMLFEAKNQWMARALEAEAQISAIGAGGVEALRKRECLQQIAEPAPQGEKVYAALPKAGPIGYASVADVQSYAKTMSIGPHLPGVRDVSLWTSDQMRAFADATAALRAAPPAPAAVSGSVMSALQEARGVISSINRSRSHQVKVNDETVFWQRGEWVEWAVNEVLPLIDAALAAAPASASDTESVLIDGIAYEVPAAVAGELLSLHLDLLAAAPAQAVPWENFPAYLIHYCEGDTISEEGLQHALANMLANPHFSNRCPSQEHATQLAGRHPIEALPDGHLYREVNNLLTHIGMEGRIDLDHAFVHSTMAALAAIDGGVYLDNLAATTQAPALEQDVLNALAMLEEGEWAEHFAKTELGKRLEAEITELHSELNWIKVEDRFPPACQTILVYGRPYGSKSVLPTVYTTYTGTRPRETVEDEEIKFWMPLPKPPTTQG